MNEHPIESIPAMVLGALSDAEAHAVREHVAHCPLCRAEAEAFRRSLAQDTHPAHQPQRHIKHKLMRRVAATGASAHPKPWRWQRAGLVLGCGALACLLFFSLFFGDNPRALGVLIVPSLVQLAPTPTSKLVAFTADRETVAHTLQRSPELPNTEVSLYIQRGDPRIGLAVHDLPAAPPGKSYQLWVANAQGQVSLGLLTVEHDGIAEILTHAPAPIETYTDFMVTVEPDGGASLPSEHILWQIKL